MTTSEIPPNVEIPARKLYRSRQQRILGGVCGGLAEYFNLDVILVRILWIIFTLMGGAGVLAYVIMWIVIPPHPQQEISLQRASGSAGVGILLIILGLLLLFAWPHWLGHFLSVTAFWIILPGLFLAIGLGLLLGLLLTRTRDSVAGTVRSERGPLYRSRDNRVLAGVCGGLAKYFNLDPTVARLLWVLFSLASLGLALLIYVVMILVVPEEPFG
jgi:phage shock protein PspC (stress-responsive transcriptional regulator)